MRYFGIHVGHDASIAIFDKCGNLSFYAEAERYGSRLKNHHNDLSFIFKKFPHLAIRKNDVLVISSTKEEADCISIYDDYLIRKPKSGYGQSKIKNTKFRPDFVIDHHLAHAISSWCFRNSDDERLFIACDGAGASADPNCNYKSSLVGIINKKDFYRIENASLIPSSTCLASLLGENSAGKAMGLSGFFPDVCSMEFNKYNLIKILEETINWNNFTRKEICFLNPDKKDLNFVIGFYKIIIDCIWEKIKENIEKFSKGRGIIIGGGTALALELNTRIYNLTQDLTFGPPVNDSGLCLGAAAFAFFHVNKCWPKAISTISMNEISHSLPSIGPQEPKEIAQLIANDKVIGLLRGKAECGPRALGHRSIFANACKYENLRRVSEHLKGREYYRPLAPIVTSEQFDRYFIGPKGEYMQYKCECTEEAQRELPAIVHRDNSARPQVVYKEKDPWLYELLVEYGSLSGHECFINTSLNGKNKPICNTYEDALEDFKDKDIELISKKYYKNKYFL